MVKTIKRREECWEWVTERGGGKGAVEVLMIMRSDGRRRRSESSLGGEEVRNDG